MFETALALWKAVLFFCFVLFRLPHILLRENTNFYRPTLKYPIQDIHVLQTNYAKDYLHYLIF